MTPEQRAQNIKLAIFDVDGVLTDGSLFFGGGGPEIKAFNVRDGAGIKYLQRANIEIAIITGRESDAVTRRAADLGIAHLYQGQLKKIVAYRELLNRLSLTDDQVAYMGDDVIDLPIMRQAGLALTVADAHPLAQQHAHWQSKFLGGKGAVREAAEFILAAQNQLDAIYAEYLCDA